MGEELKAGVGIAVTPREALGLATLALDTIRRGGDKKGKILVMGLGDGPSRNPLPHP